MKSTNTCSLVQWAAKVSIQITGAVSAWVWDNVGGQLEITHDSKKKEVSLGHQNLAG